MLKTLRYSISSILLICVFSVTAQINKIDSTKTIKSLFKNVRLDIDVVPLITSIISKNDTYTFEAALQTELLQKYYPIVEIGFGGANKISTTDIGFKTNGAFGRIGLDFNLIKPKTNKPKTNNFFFAGARLGFTSFNYNLTNVVIENSYWYEKTTLDYLNVTATKIWFEMGVGIRVEVVKNIYMGWSIKNKKLFGEDLTGEMSPWFIPGYGINNTSNWGVNYMIGYKF